MKEKKIVLFNFVLFLIIGFGITIYYKHVCSTGICSHQDIRGFIIPTELGAYISAFFFLPFILLPTTYFKNWFKYIFSWAFPLTIYLVYITTGSSSIPAYGKEDVVKFWGIFYAIVTLFFVVITFLKTKK
jgi:hypothetical protein